MRIKIDGILYNVTNIINGSYLPLIETDDGLEFYLAESSEAAGEANREYWKDMAENDPEEFACIVGEKTLIAWGSGQSAAPGSIAVNSLQEWLDLTADYPAEQWAGYDGLECEVTRVGTLVTELGFVPTVAYRHN